MSLSTRRVVPSLDASLLNIIAISGSGGAICGGAAKLDPVPSGGAVCSGSGLDVYLKLFGGVKCGGTAIAEVVDHRPMLVCSGNAILSVVKSEVASGGVICGGMIITSFTIIPSGGVIIGGAAGQAFQPFVAGGVICGATAVPILKINLVKKFSWNIGTGIAAWYRIEGDCKPRTCPPLSDPEPISPCPTTAIVNVMARSTDEIFQRLTDLNFAWPILTIKKFSTPALITETPTGLDTTCNHLVDITSTVAVPPQYANFFVVEDLTASVSIKVSVETDIIEIVPDTSTPITISGSMPYTSGPFPGIVMSGSMPIAASGFTVPMGGEIVIGGSAAHGQSFYAFTGSGSIVVSGSAPSPTSSFAFTGGGTMRISGSADYDEAGTEHLDVSIGVSASLESESATFAELSSNTIVAVQTPIIVPCCINAIPAIISLSHNMSDLNGLSQFLLRNGLSLPAKISMSYNPVSSSWQANLHYAGLGFNIPEQVTWTLTFEFACVTTAGIINVGSGAWKISMLASFKNLYTGSKSSTRILMYFSTQQVCENVLNFTATMNVATQQVLPTPILVAVFDDDAELFQNQTWTRNPLLKFNLSPAPGTPPTQTVPYPEILIPVTQPHSGPP